MLVNQYLMAFINASYYCLNKAFIYCLVFFGLCIFCPPFYFCLIWFLYATTKLFHILVIILNISTKLLYATINLVDILEIILNNMLVLT